MTLPPHTQFDPYEKIRENSFSNFHTKGIDYLCLKRSPELTIKAYFFNDVNMPFDSGITCPHDHLYDFETYVLKGRQINFIYEECSPDNPFASQNQKFVWDTPLRDGSGFTWEREVFLAPPKVHSIHAPKRYDSKAEAIHSILPTPDTILIIKQFASREGTTSTFVPGHDKEPPRLDGLYDRMPEQDIFRRMLLLRDAFATPL